MKTVRVVAAIIRENGRIFATERGYGPYKDFWEFPGGKIEAGESPEEALVREIREELEAVIRVDRYLTTVEYDYPDFHLSMQCFFARWLGKEELYSVDWLPADREIIDLVRQEWES